MPLKTGIKYITGLILLIITTSTFANTKATLSQIVEYHRAMLLLLDKSPSNDPLADTIFAARNVYAAKQEQTEALLNQIEQEITQQAASKEVQLTPASIALIEFTDKALQQHPGDLLGLGDIYDEFASLEKARPLPEAEAAKLQQALNQYNKVFTQYRSDYGKALDKLVMRGERFELWADYIKFLRSQYNADELLQLYSGEKAQLFRYKTRGANDTKAKTDVLVDKAPKVLWGNSLPDKTVVLTFDDGPHHSNTAQILDILKQYEVHGYFFSVGRSLGNTDATAKTVTSTHNTAIAKRIVAEGNILANHSYSHAILTKLDQDGRKAELAKTNLLIQKSTGTTNALFRPPYGSHDKELDALSSDEGMVSILWNIDSMDWADPIPESIVEKVLQQVDKDKKGILLFHDTHTQVIKALPAILDGLAERGFKVVTLDGRSFAENAAGLPKIQPVDNNPYGTSWAVVIGINQYQAWPKLEYAVNDAKAVAEQLETKLGFAKANIITLFDADATAERITEVLGYQLADPKKVSANDRVFIFYAGHGATRELPNGKALGYLIPVDAEVDKFQNRGISMTQINDFSALIPAKHIYFVMDSCYSGLALTRAGPSGGQAVNYINQITSRKARQILTAGGADQQVADGGPNGHSIFTWTFLQAIEGLADTDNNGYVTASEIGTYVSPVVASYAQQTPSFGNLLGSEGGDFVFKVQPNAQAEINQKIQAESKRIEDELNSVRQNTTANVKRRLELEMSLAQEKAGASTANSTNNSTTPAATQGTQAVAINPGQDEVIKGNSPDARKTAANKLNVEALAFMKEKKYPQAKTAWAEAIRLNPYNAGIVNNYAYVLDMLNENDNALKWYYRAVELDPKRTSLYFNLGDMMVKMGRPLESIAYYEQFLHLYPSFKDAKLIRDKIESFKKISTDTQAAQNKAELEKPEK